MKKIGLILITILLSGCTSRKCIKSHQEQDRCVKYSYNNLTVIPRYYECVKTVCDEYKEVEE